MLHLFDRVKKDVVVALSGECSDEIFGGYVWFHMPEFLDKPEFPWNFNDAKMLRKEVNDKVQALDLTRKTYDELLKQVPRLPGESPKEARLREMSFLNIYGMMQNLLDRKDLMSMRQGLEVRVPFADQELVQYVFNIPWSMKSVDGQPKGILRRAMRGLLPDPIVEREKTPYPRSHDPNHAIKSAEQLLQAIEGGTKIFEIFDETLVRKLIANTLEGKIDHSDVIFVNVAFHLGWLLQTHHFLNDYNVRLEL